MNHTLYIRERKRGRTIKEVISGTANYLGVSVKFDQIMIVETDDADLAHLVRTLATANGELLDLVDPATVHQPTELMTREEVEQNLVGESPIETFRNGNHAKPVMEMVAEVTEPPDPPAKKARKPRTYQPKQCEVCGQMYTPTGPRAKHKNCPGKANGTQSETPSEEHPAEDPPADQPTGDESESLPYWERLLTGEMIENNTLLRMVRAGEYSLGERFDNGVAGLHEVAKTKNGDGFYLRKVKQPALVCDPE